MPLLLVGLISLWAPTRAADRCTAADEERVAACTSGKECVWHYVFETNVHTGGHQVERLESWCYDSREKAIAAGEAKVRADNSAWPDRVTALTGEVFCDACRDPTSKPAIAINVAGTAYAEWRRQVETVRLIDLLGSPPAGGATASWAKQVYKQVGAVGDELERLMDRIQSTGLAGTQDASKQLDQFGDDLRDAGASAAGTIAAASPTWKPQSLPQGPEVFGVAPGEWLPAQPVDPYSRADVRSASAIRYTARTGADGRVHVAWQNPTDEPLEFTFTVAGGTESSVSVAPHSGDVTVVSGYGPPSASTGWWGQVRDLKVKAAPCRSGTVRDTSTGTCKNPCPSGMAMVDAADGARCECEDGLSWDARYQRCSDGCPAGATLVHTARGQSCTCNAGLRWDGVVGTCVKDTCGEGAHFDVASGACACAPGTVWVTASASCAAVTCGGGTVLNAATATCDCPASTHFDSSSRTCECPAGQRWSDASRSCGCPSGTTYVASRSACMSTICSTAAEFDFDAGNCACIAPTHYDSASRTCSCGGGQRWDSASRSCDCPSGTAYVVSKAACVSTTCSGIAEFNDDTGACECPSPTHYDSASRACSCGGGQRWDSASRSCGCPSGREWVASKSACVSTTCATGYAFDAGTGQCVDQDPDRDGVLAGNDRCPTVAGSGQNGGCPASASVKAPTAARASLVGSWNCGPADGNLAVTGSASAPIYLENFPSNCSSSFSGGILTTLCLYRDLTEKYTLRLQSDNTLIMDKLRPDYQKRFTCTRRAQ